MSHSKEEYAKQPMKQFDFANQFTLGASSDCGIYQTGSTVLVHTIQGELTKQRQREVEGGKRIIQVKMIQRFQLKNAFLNSNTLKAKKN